MLEKDTYSELIIVLYWQVAFEFVYAAFFKH